VQNRLGTDLETNNFNKLNSYHTRCIRNVISDVSLDRVQSLGRLNMQDPENNGPNRRVENKR